MLNISTALGRRQFLCGCCTAIGSAALPSQLRAEDPNIVPVEMAPYHILPFKNEYAKFIVSRIPPGKIGSWHRHSRDFAFVYAQAPVVEVANLGKPPAKISRKTGEVVFANYSAQPLVHQITNIGEHDFHIMGIELLEGPVGRFTPQDRPPPYVKVMENERLIGWRLVLEPQQSADSIVQSAPAARFVVRSGTFVEGYPDKSSHELNLSAGDFAWIDSGVSREMKNVGSSTLELVEFELK